MKKNERFFYLTNSANKALEQMYTDQLAVGPKVSYSDLVCRALETFETVGFKKTSCESDKCGYYYVYQCHCQNISQPATESHGLEVTCFDGKDYENSKEW